MKSFELIIVVAYLDELECGSRSVSLVLSQVIILILIVGLLVGRHDNDVRVSITLQLYVRICNIYTG